MKWQFQSLAALTLLAASPINAQKMGPSLPSPGADPDCSQSAPDSDEIIVCGHPDRGDEYRIPEDLRGTGQIDSRNMARSALERDSRSLGQYSAQTVGPFGALQRARQVRCAWTAARQAQQGRQIDCSAKARRDDTGDWQRGRR